MAVEPFKVCIGVLTAFLLAPGLWSSDLHAQVHEDPFSRVELSLSFHKDINESQIHKFWSSDGGVHLNFRWPFYRGYIGLEFRFDSFVADNELVPDFNQLQAAAGWIKRVRLGRKISLQGGANFLFSRFNFKNVTEQQKNRADLFGVKGTEIEVGLGLKGGINYHIGNEWMLHSRLNRRVIFTSTKLKLTYLEFGITRSFNLSNRIQHLME